MIFKLLALIAFGALSAAAMGQTSQSFSLIEAQNYAVEHAFAVKNARMDALKAEREVKEVLASGLPQLNGSLEYNSFIDIPVQVAQGDVFGFPDYLVDFLGGVAQETGVSLNAPAANPDAISEFQFGADQTVTAGLSASQLIFDGSFFIGVQASKVYAESMVMRIEKSEADTKTAVAEAYHLVLISRENASLLETSRIVLEKTFTETTALFENGFAEEMDVDQLQLSLADLDSRINYAENQAKIAVDMLKFQMGLDLRNEISLTDNIESFTNGNEAGSMLTTPFVIGNNYDFRVQTQNVTLAKLGVKNEKARGLPSVGAFYSYQENAQRFEFNFLDGDQAWYPTQLWGVQLKVPIFAGGAGSHRVQKAKIDLERAEATLVQIEQGAMLEYNSSKLEFDFAIDQREIQNRNLMLAQRIFDKTQIKYNEGVSTSFELTQAQNQLLTSQGNYINSTLQLLNARTRLNKALSNL
jgi:outer membrane protein